MSMNRWKDKLKETADQAKGLSQGVSVKARELGGQIVQESKTRMQGTLDGALREIENLRPILNQAGFVIGDIMFSITIPPQVRVTLRKFEECAEQLNALLADPDNELNDTQRTVLTLLAKANSLSEVTSKHGYLFSEFDLAMSIPPQLSIHLVSKRSLNLP